MTTPEPGPAGTPLALETENGLTTVNGFRSRNGLISTLLLSLTNGLTTVRGVTNINGLVTVDGKTSVDGKSVDCAGKNPGVDCTGEPDGLLSNGVGLMSSDDGVRTTHYLIRCALPADDSIGVLDYDGNLVTFNGELGLTPDWKGGACNDVCQEKISACLMAFTNGDGVSVPIEMSASFTLGVGTTPDYPYQEAAFYGNLFTTPAEAYFCVGKDYADVTRYSVKLYEVRACQGYNTDDGVCPYVLTGLCNNEFGLRSSVMDDDRCSWTGPRDDTASRCAGSDGDFKTWHYPITTFRMVRD